MNFSELENVIKHIQKSCTCLQCKNKYEVSDIQIVATTGQEGLFETKCQKCNCSTIINVLLAPEETEIKETRIKKKHSKISHDDILDIKNFLSNFDGNFKKIFHFKK